MWEFIKQNWGNLASVIGLIISIVTLLFARRASQAAKEAKAAVLRRNVADDLEDAERQAQEIIFFLGQKQWSISRLKADELHRKALWIRERWASLLTEESRTQIIDAMIQLNLLVENLDKIVDNNLSDEQLKRLTEAAKRTRDMFLREHAKFLAKTD
jgi:hypothetical protein